jgi:butyrate kinase
MADDRAFTIAVINPGGTSTKVACYRGDRELFSRDVRHDESEIRSSKSVFQQKDWRLAAVKRLLRAEGIDTKSLDGVVGRGGPVAPVPSGTFLVDEVMLEAIRAGEVMVSHPSLLGAVLADELAHESGCSAYVVDPVSVDELVDEARLTGLPEIPRRALSHALNVKAASRVAAGRMGRRFEEVNLVVAHLGSGTTVAAQRRGIQIDATDASASGPMAPTRTGSLPGLDLVRLCFSGKYDLGKMEKLLVGEGGWKAHLSTDDVREIYARIDDGDDDARLVLEATLLQIAKEVAAMASVLRGEVDAVVLTGGVARSKRFIDELVPRIEWISEEIHVVAGENEMEALAQGALRVLAGECTPLSMGPYIERWREGALRRDSTEEK